VPVFGYDPVTMPFKSQAQRRKFAQLLVDGKITPQTYEEWNRETGGTRLPERVAKARKKKRPAPKRKTPTRKAPQRKAKRKATKRKTQRKAARKTPKAKRR
jgi:hypothetical protein